MFVFGFVAPWFEPLVVGFVFDFYIAYLFTLDFVGGLAWRYLFV